MRLGVVRSFQLGIVALLPLGAVLAQQRPIVDDPLLREALVRHEDRQFSAGVSFPEEALTCLYYQNAIVDHIVNDFNGDPKILLTSVATNSANYKLFPNIVHMADAGYWVRTPVPMTRDGWTHVHVSEDGQHVVLLMDNIPQSAGWDTRFVVSNDGGKSWRYGDSIRKYIYFDVISYFRMSETGSGTAIEYYDGGVSGYDDVGYYIFETSDWGMTWSGRIYEVELDTSGYVDVLPGYRQRNSTTSVRAPLSGVALLGFHDCPSP